MDSSFYVFEKGYYELLIKLLSAEIKPFEFNESMQSLIADLNRNLLDWFNSYVPNE